MATSVKNRKREIENEIMAGLGMPDRFSHVVVKRLWSNHYRANVYCYTGEFGVVRRRKISHSYFVRALKDRLVFDPALERAE
jgi:hypothetical protein